VAHPSDAAADFSEFGEDCCSQGVTKVLALVANLHGPLTGDYLQYLAALTAKWAPRRLGVLLRELQMLPRQPGRVDEHGTADTVVAVLRSHKAVEGEGWPEFVATVLRELDGRLALGCAKLLYHTDPQGPSVLCVLTRPMEWTEVLHVCLYCTESLIAAHNFICHTGRALTSNRATALITFLFTRIWAGQCREGTQSPAHLARALCACLEADILGAGRIDLSRPYALKRLAVHIAQGWPAEDRAEFLAVTLRTASTVNGYSGTGSSDGSDCETE